MFVRIQTNVSRTAQDFARLTEVLREAEALAEKLARQAHHMNADPTNGGEARLAGEFGVPLALGNEAKDMVDGALAALRTPAVTILREQVSG